MTFDKDKIHTYVCYRDTMEGERVRVSEDRLLFIALFMRRPKVCTGGRDSPSLWVPPTTALQWRAHLPEADREAGVPSTGFTQFSG